MRPIERIQKRLGELGKAKTSASLEAGLSASFIRTMEIDPNKSMTAANAEKLAKVLKTTPEWILFGVGQTSDNEAADRFQLDADVLDIATLKTDQMLVSYHIKVSRQDRIKMIAYHYEDEMRKRHKLPPITEK